MQIYSAFILFSLIIIVYVVIAEVFIILFRFTGMDREKAGYEAAETKKTTERPAALLFSNLQNFFSKVAITAFITAALKPDCSSVLTPWIVLPPGEHTLSLRIPGCSPVSSSISAVPLII